MNGTTRRRGIPPRRQDAPVHVVFVISTTPPNSHRRHKVSFLQRGRRPAPAGPCTRPSSAAACALPPAGGSRPAPTSSPSRQRAPLPLRPPLHHHHPPAPPPDRPRRAVGVFRHGPGPRRPQSPDGVNGPDRTSSRQERPELPRSRPRPGTCVHQMPPARTVTRPDPRRFVEHLCQTHPQTEDTMHPKPVPVPQPPGIESCRSPGITNRWSRVQPQEARCVRCGNSVFHWLLGTLSGLARHSVS